MKQLNGALLEEFKNDEEAILILEGTENEYIEAIKILEEKVENMRREASSKANGDLETQISLDHGETELQLSFRICIYVATCEEELWMMHMLLILIWIFRQILLVRFVVNGAELSQI